MIETKNLNFTNKKGKQNFNLPDIALNKQENLLILGKSNLASKTETNNAINAEGKYLIPVLSETHYHWRNMKSSIENEFKSLILQVLQPPVTWLNMEIKTM